MNRSFRERFRRFSALLLICAMLAACFGALAETTATVVASSVTVYSTPALSSSDALGTMKKGEKVTVRAISGILAKITWNNRTCYVDATKLSCGGEVKESATASPSSGTSSFANKSAIVTADSLTIYKSASTSAGSYGTARKGASLTVLAVNGSWAAVRVGGKDGYCKVSGLSIYAETQQAAPAESEYTAPSTPTTTTQTATVKAASLVIYKKASKSSGSFGSAMKGTTVTVLATSGAWAAVSVGGKIGYCALSGLSISSAETDPSKGMEVTVSGSSLTLFKSASKSSETYGSVKKGTKVTLLEELGSWAKIRYNGNIYYCALSGLSSSAQPDPTPTGSTGYTVNEPGNCVCAEDLYMYKTASTTGGYYGKFKEGAIVTITALSGKWAKVTYSSKTGYVLRAGLNPSDVTKIDSSSYTHKAVSKTSLYQKPSTSSKVLKTISSGTKIKVSAKSGGWLKLTYSGVVCYALEKDFIETSSTKSAIIVYAEQSVYSAAKTSASIYGTVHEGDKVEVYSSESGWASILYNGKKGYVPTVSLVSCTATYTTLKSGDSGSTVLSMQTRLEVLGYFDGIPAGNYGSITTTAIQNFQNERGMSVTGTASPATQAALFSATAPESTLLGRTFSSGSSGNLVKRLQTRLLYKNYYTSSIDGDYGDDTVAAVASFQAAAGLTKNGIADPVTLKALYSNNAPSGKTQKPAGSHGTKSLDPPDCDSGNEDIELVIRYALAQLGKPYVYGTAGPNSFDCSGLTYYCFKKIGITLPRSAYDVGYSKTLGTRIAYEDLKRGDIVCFNTIGDSDLSDHVGLYLGDGKFIHAPHTGCDVIIADMSTGYYQKNFSWGRRVIK